MKKMILCILVLAINYITISAKEIEIVTEDYPPFQYRQDGVITGPSTEVVQSLFKKVDMPYSLNIYPWPRAYHLALSDENVLIYSITRTKKRENIFKWVGAIMFKNIYIWKLKSRKDIRVDTLVDTKKYKIAGIRKDAKMQYLLENGFIKEKNIFLVYEKENIVKLLYAHRTDLIVDNVDIKLQAKKLGFDSSQLEQVLVIKELSGELYAAFSLMTSDEVVDKFKKALEELKQEGEFYRIINKYK